MNNPMVMIDQRGMAHDPARWNAGIRPKGLHEVRISMWDYTITATGPIENGLPQQIEDLPAEQIVNVLAANRRALVERGFALPSESDYSL